MANNQTKERTTLFHQAMKRLQEEHILVVLSEDGQVLKEYPLSEISEQEVKQLKESKKAGFVFKQTRVQDFPKYWFAPIEEKINLNWFKHNCGNCSLLGTKEGANLQNCAWAHTINSAIYAFEELQYLENAIIVFGDVDNVLKINCCAHFKPDSCSRICEE